MIKIIQTSNVPRIRSGHSSGFTRRDIQTFIDSGAQSAEVFTEGTKNPLSARAAYDQMLKKMNAPVSVVMRGDRIFLIRREENVK